MWYRQKVDKWRKGEIDWDGNPLISETQAAEHKMEQALDKATTRRLVLHLRLDALAGLFNLVALLGDASKASGSAPPAKEEDASHAVANTDPASVSSTEEPRPTVSRPLEVHGVRLVELTDRTSSVMQSAELDEFSNRDIVFSAFQTFSRLHGVAVAGQVSVIPTSAYAETLVKCAQEARSDFMLVPWSTHGGMSEENPAAVLSETSSPNDRFFSRSYLDYVEGAVKHATCTTGIYIGRSPNVLNQSRRPTLSRSAFTGLSVQCNHDSPVLHTPVNQNTRILFPFIGGKDDRSALLFVLQLAHNPRVSITVLHLVFSEDDPEFESHTTPTSNPSNSAVKNFMSGPSASDFELLNTAKNNASSTLAGRVTFTEVSVDSIRNLPDRAVAHALETVGKSRQNVGDLIVVGRSHTFLEGLLVDDFGLERDFQRTVGVLGDRFARAGINADLLVMNDGSK